jgi:DNA-binding beta-propeller fold protein YncE
VKRAKILVGIAFGAALAGCGSSTARRPAAAAVAPLAATTRSPSARTPRGNVYAFTAANMLSPAVRGMPALVYVPNSMSNTVDVISQRTMKVVAHYAVGALPQHVTPSWDMRTLYVDNDSGNSLTPINPHTGRPKGRPIPVTDPYNMYFSQNGRYAIVVAEARGRLDFRDAHTMALRHSLPVRCKGVDHMDFSASGRYVFASCEFDGTVLKINLARRRIVRRLRLHHGRASPQDVKLSPDGRILYVADQVAGGLWEIQPKHFKVIGFLPTGLGVHGLYPSRDARLLYATNRAEGSISVISFRKRRVIHKWKLPGHASPDMGGVSVDGATLWLSGRYDGVVYAINARSGKLIKQIKVGNGPHGLCVWPQPGRFSLGHTGITR